MIPLGLLFTLEEISIQNLVEHRRCHAILVWRGEKLTFQENHTGTALTEGSIVSLTTGQIWGTRRFGGGGISFCHKCTTKRRVLLHKYKYKNFAFSLKVWKSGFDHFSVAAGMQGTWVKCLDIQPVLLFSLWKVSRKCQTPGCNCQGPAGWQVQPHGFVRQPEPMPPHSAGHQGSCSPLGHQTLPWH